MADPYLVGVLDDTGSSAGLGLERWLRLAADDLLASDRLDREVEFVHVASLGLPQGTAANVQRAYRELVDHDVLLIVGPAIGDNALVATPGRRSRCAHHQLGGHRAGSRRVDVPPPGGLP